MEFTGTPGAILFILGFMVLISLVVVICRALYEFTRFVYRKIIKK